MVKYLSFSLQKLCERNIVTCPLCRHKSRKEPYWEKGKLLDSQIGNNTYALDNIALRKKVKVMQSR